MDGKPKRPIWVWVIMVYVALTTTFTAISFSALLSGQISFAPAQQAYFAALTPLDYAVTAAIVACMVCGAANLFLLRKIALKFFIAALACNAGLTLWESLSGRMVPGGMPGMIFGLLQVLAMVLYTAYLAKKQIIV